MLVGQGDDVAGDVAVDRAVDVVYESMVDQPLKSNRYAILTVHHRSKGPGRVRAGCSGDVAGDRGGAAAPRRELAGVPYLAAQGAISCARRLYA
jgi:hypothetical protein